MLSLHFLGALLWQRRLALVATFLGTLTILAGLILAMPSQYVAESLLAIDSRPMRSVQGTLSGQDRVNPFERVDGTVVSGEINLLTSRPLMERVIEQLRLDQDPTFAARNGLRARVQEGLAGLLRATGLGAADPGSPSVERRDEELLRAVSKGLTVEIPRGSSQIRVSYRSTDPAISAAVVNALVDAYLDEQRQAKESVATTTLAGLRERLEGLQQRLEAADRAVQAFRDEHGLLKTEGVSPLVQQLNELTLAEQRARTEAEDARARLALLRTLGSSLEAVAALSEGNQRLLGDLIAQEADARARLASAAARLGSAHPEVQQLRAQAQAMTSRLAAQRSVIGSTLESEATVLTRRHERLAAALQTVRDRVHRENELEARLEQLNTQARAARTAYDDFLVSYNRALALERSAVADVRVLYDARVPGLPALPKLPMLLLAAAVSALVAIVAAVLFHLRAAARRQTAREFETLYGVPVIGMTPVMPRQSQTRNPAVYLGRSPLSEYAEAVRGIRNAIDFERRKVTSVAIVSAQAGEGKSTLALSLAVAWAAAGARTLVIDCDTRRSSLPDMVEAERKEGLTNILAASSPGALEVQRNPRLGFDLLAAGPGGGDTTYRFTRDTVGELIARFEDRYDKIILDLPPLLAVADAEVGAAASDLVVFVNHWGRTKPEATQSALERLRRFGVMQVRGVFSQVDRRQYMRLGSVSRHLYRPYGDDHLDAEVHSARA
jgi:capsular exopolysaccharide synthesis family protein